MGTETVAIGLDEVHRARTLVHGVVVNRILVHLGNMRGVNAAQALAARRALLARAVVAPELGLAVLNKTLPT